ncbi:MAG: hypothetical protein ACREQO_05845 [Candidatus Binatia bacterium]
MFDEWRLTVGTRAAHSHIYSYRPFFEALHRAPDYLVGRKSMLSEFLGQLFSNWQWKALIYRRHYTGILLAEIVMKDKPRN